MFIYISQNQRQWVTKKTVITPKNGYLQKFRHFVVTNQDKARNISNRSKMEPASCLRSSCMNLKDERLKTRWTIIFNATTVLMTQRLEVYCCFCCCSFLLILFLRSRQSWRDVLLRRDVWTLLLLRRFCQQCLNLIKNISDWIRCNWEVRAPSTATTLTFYLLCVLTWFFSQWFSTSRHIF
jgi:hypothetical protein